MTLFDAAAQFNVFKRKNNLENFDYIVSDLKICFPSTR